MFWLCIAFALSGLVLIGRQVAHSTRPRRTQKAGPNPALASIAEANSRAIQVDGGCGNRKTGKSWAGRLFPLLQWTAGWHRVTHAIAPVRRGTLQIAVFSHLGHHVASVPLKDGDMVNSGSVFGRIQTLGPSSGLWLRVVTISLLAGISGCLLYSHLDTDIGVVPFWIIAGLVYAIVIGITAFIAFAFLPKLAQLVKLTAVSRLILSCAAAADAELAFSLLSSPLLNGTLVIGIAILLRALGGHRAISLTPRYAQAR